MAINYNIIPAHDEETLVNQDEELVQVSAA